MQLPIVVIECEDNVESTVMSLAQKATVKASAVRLTIQGAGAALGRRTSRHVTETVSKRRTENDSNPRDRSSRAASD